MVAKLKGLGDAEYTVKPEETYAEMWIGTHPSGPSRVVRDGSPGPLLKVPIKVHLNLKRETDRKIHTQMDNLNDVCCGVVPLPIISRGASAVTWCRTRRCSPRAIVFFITDLAERKWHRRG